MSGRVLPVSWNIKDLQKIVPVQVGAPRCRTSCATILDMKRRKDRVLEYAGWLTWQDDLCRKAWLPWSAWQVPSARATLARWSGQASWQA